MRLRSAINVFIAVAATFLAGCSGAAERKTFLTVDFQQDKPLRYKFVSSRAIETDWGTVKSGTGRGRQQVDKSSESMSMVVTYTPVKVDPYGLTAIEAACESVKVERSASKGRRSAGRDAVENLPGKTFTLTVSPAGEIEDYLQLDKLIEQIGRKAFRPDRKRGRIKEPDMISDFIATQWFLWDPVSSIEKPSKGLSVGQRWQSKLSVPTPMVMRKARDVTYTLDEIRQSEKGRLAVIRSSYSLAESVPRDWPVPYTGRFRMSGKFGFLRGYKVLDLQGEGEELFNIDKGRIEQYNQQYQMRLEAFMPMSIDVKPLITIDQNLTMALLED